MPVEGTLIRPGNKGVFNLETILEETRTLDAQVTKHPVENGSQISDHVILQNKKFRVDAIVSDATFADDNTGVRVNIPQLNILERVISQIGFISQFVSIGQPGPTEIVNQPDQRAVAAEARRVLEEIRDNREVLILETSIGQFNNLILTSISSTRNSSISNRSFRFTLGLEQIQLVESSATILFVETKPDVKDEAAAKKEANKQGTSDVDLSQSQLELLLEDVASGSGTVDQILTTLNVGG